MNDLLLVGLGNKGNEYKFTRHNIGFIFLDYITNLLYGNIKFKLNKNLEGEIFEKNNIIFLKPNNYMNLSGISVKKVKDFYRIKNDSIFVVQDDIEKDIGFYKISFNQEGSGGHNGIRSIHSQIGKDFHRIRIGVGKNTEKYNNSVSDFVLSDFKEEELEVIKSKFEYIARDLKLII